MKYGITEMGSNVIDVCDCKVKVIVYWTNNTQKKSGMR